MTNYDVAKKLIGSVVPVGETNTDNARFENLKELCELAEELIEDIRIVAGFSDRDEFSIKRVAEYANSFLSDLQTTPI